MIIGFDNGASAIKIVALNGERIAFKKCLVGSKKSAFEILTDFLAENGIPMNDVSAIAVTGVGAEKCCFDGIGNKVSLIPEIEATGEGGTWLSKCDEAIVVSIGTGTSIVLSRGGKFTHIGGSGVGSGTLRGFSRKIFGISDVRELFKFAEGGNRFAVDLTIGDLFSGTDTLPQDLTASNLAKCGETATERDWAAAIINTIMEVAGSHAALACNGFGVKNVVITGGISQTKMAKAAYDNFSKLYKLNYIIPEYSGCATAIGAARRILNGA